MIDFSVANHAIVDKFIIKFTKLDFYITDESLPKSTSCDEQSNVAIKFKQFDTTASLVLISHNGSSTFSETFQLIIQVIL